MTPNPTTLAASEFIAADYAAEVLEESYAHLTAAAAGLRNGDERSEILLDLRRTENRLAELPWGADHWVAVKAATVKGIVFSALRLASASAVDLTSPVGEALGDLMDQGCLFLGNLATYARDEANAYAEEGEDR